MRERRSFSAFEYGLQAEVTHVTRIARYQARWFWRLDSTSQIRYMTSRNDTKSSLHYFNAIMLWAASAKELSRDGKVLSIRSRLTPSSPSAFLGRSLEVEQQESSSLFEF